MRNLIGGLVALLFAAASGGAFAHEFWLLPDRFEAAPGSTLSLSLFVGVDYKGDQVGISQPLVADLKHYSAEGAADLHPIVPAAPAVASLPLRTTRAGTHLIAMDSHPSAIELPADRFTAYLELEGLQQVIKARAASAAAALPGRERFRRNVKTLVNVGGLSDSTFARRTGQRLEIVPLRDPYQAALDKPMGFQVAFDARPLPGALVKFWNRSGPALVALSARTDAQGKVAMVLPQAGTWMVSLVHMIPVTDSTQFDWDSYWGNLTFQVRSQADSSAPRR